MEGALFYQGGNAEQRLRKLFFNLICPRYVAKNHF